MKCGFGSPNYPKDQQRAISSLGGKAAHAQHTAHEWTSKEASAAGKKGGLATQRNARPSPPSRTERTFGDD